MNPSTIVSVNLGLRSYHIHIETGGLSRLGELVQGEFATKGFKLTSVAMIADGAIAESHGAFAKRSLEAVGIPVTLFEVPSGEGSKSVEQLDRLWNLCESARLDRKSAIVAIGGGVVGDLAGFVAATYARGIPFIQVPTTLLAHVDSSVGGKVGINLSGAKNMVGCFWQPAFVLIDPRTLETLPEREYGSGLAEVVKYGVILDESLFEFLERNAPLVGSRDLGVITEIIAWCCRLKASVVEGDEREESGGRAVLNYGHTFGHALESVTQYEKFLHGEAVSLGMDRAATLALRLGLIDDGFLARQRRLLSQLGLPTRWPTVNPEGIIGAMQSDKKFERGEMRFVLPTRFGKAISHGIKLDHEGLALVRSVIEPK